MMTPYNDDILIKAAELDWALWRRERWLTNIIYLCQTGEGGDYGIYPGG